MTSPPPPVSARPAPRRRGLAGRVAFALVALPVLLAAVGGLAASRLGGAWSWPLQLLAIGLPYVAMGAGALSLYAATTRRPRWLLALAVPVGLVVARGWPASAAGAQDGDLVLTTFNVPPSEPRDALADSLVAFTARTQPHVLAVQDTWVYPGGPAAHQAGHVRAVDERGPYRLVAPARPLPRAGWQRGGTATPLLVRVTPRAADAAAGRLEVLAQDEVSLGDGDDTSLAQRTLVRWQGREAVLYNVHLRSYGEPKPWNDPAVSLRDPATWRPYAARFRRVFGERHAEADRLAERLAAERLPVLVVGDFNSTTGHYAVQRLRHARAGAPLADAYRAAAGWRWGRTYHARQPLVRIDFVLADPEAFEVTRARTFPVTYSDHRPVEVRLRWRAAPDPTADSTATRGAEARPAADSAARR